MTITDNSLAATFEPMACRECNAQGLTADQCARILHCENMLRIALAEQRDTPAAASIRAAAKHADRQLEKLMAQDDMVAIIDRLGFPQSVTTLHDKRLERALRAGRLQDTTEPDVFQLS